MKKHYVGGVQVNTTEGDPVVYNRHDLLHTHISACAHTHTSTHTHGHASTRRIYALHMDAQTLTFIRPCVQSAPCAMIVRQ